MYLCCSSIFVIIMKKNLIQKLEYHNSMMIIFLLFCNLQKIRLVQKMRGKLFFNIIFFFIWKKNSFLWTTNFQYKKKILWHNHFLPHQWIQPFCSNWFLAEFWSCPVILNMDQPPKFPSWQVNRRHCTWQETEKSKELVRI